MSIWYGSDLACCAAVTNAGQWWLTRVRYVAGVGLRSPSWWLQFLSVAHVGVGAIRYRVALGDIARRRLLNSVSASADNAAAFWFMAVAPALWVSGRLLRSAEASGDLDAQRAAGAVLTAVGVVGSSAIGRRPSGFWGVTAVGIALLRRSTGSALP